MIRPATSEDAERLVEMGRAFFQEAGHESPETPFDPSSFIATLAIFAQAKLLLVCEKGGEVVGMAAADVAPAFWNRSILLGREAFFYIVPSARKGLGRKILAAIETAAKEYGATYFDVVAEPGPRSLALAELYRRSGYNLSESSYRKRL